MEMLRSHKLVRRVSGFLCLFFFVLVHPVSSTPLGTDEKVLSNYDILEKLSSEAMHELLSNMPRFPG